MIVELRPLATKESIEWRQLRAVLAHDYDHRTNIRHIDAPLLTSLINPPLRHRQICGVRRTRTRSAVPATNPRQRTPWANGQPVHVPISVECSLLHQDSRAPRARSTDTPRAVPTTRVATLLTAPKPHGSSANPKNETIRLERNTN